MRTWWCSIYWKPSGIHNIDLYMLYGNGIGDWLSLRLLFRISDGNAEFDDKIYLHKILWQRFCFEIHLCHRFWIIWRRCMFLVVVICNYVSFDIYRKLRSMKITRRPRKVIAVIHLLITHTSQGCETGCWYLPTGHTLGVHVKVQNEWKIESNDIYQHILCQILL